MEHMVKDFLKTKKTTKSEYSKLREATPPSINMVDSYIMSNRYKTDPSYAKYLDRLDEEIKESLKDMEPISMERFALGGAIKYWKDDREEMILEIKRYIPLSIEKKEGSCFHIVALGLWKAWSEGYLQDPSLCDLVKCINKQIIETGSAPIFQTGEVNKGGQPSTVDKVNVLMTYINSEANGKETARRLGMDPKEVRRHLKATVGKDYRKILYEDHKYYEMAQVAYSYWIKDFN